MAFCPNCGTPNTDQTEKCAACGFELISQKQKPKFKGTMMMSGIKAPTQPALPGSAEANAAKPPTPAGTPPPAAVAASSTELASTGSNRMGFEKTMLGRPIGGSSTAGSPTTGTPASSSSTAGSPPVAVSPVAAPPQRAQPSEPGLGNPESRTRFSSDYDQLPIAEPLPAQAARVTPREFEPSAGASAASYAATTPTDDFAARSTQGMGSYGGTGTPAAARRSVDPRQIESTLPPPANSGPGKIALFGCLGVLAVSLVVAGLLYAAFGAKLRALFGASDSATEAAAWQASISQSLAQVAALCQVDCERAGVFFHPDMQAALLPEAKALTPERVQRLSDPSQSSASMLDGTGDESIATQRGLDPQLCARVIVDDAKVVSCSVPDPSGKPGVLRIVYLGSISTL